MESRFVTRGVVLRETVTKETDKILTLLSEDRGKLAVIARGARRANSRYSAAAQPLAFSEWTLSHRGDWYYASDAATLELFPELRRNLDALALAFYFAELTEAAALEEVPARPLVRHLLNGCYALGTLRKSPELVKPAFELKFLCLAGFEPVADACAYCGNPSPAEPVLDLVQGVVRCRTCGTEDRSPSLPLCRDSLAALRHIVYGDEKRLYSFRMGPEALRRLSAASEGFLSAQLERNFRTLDFYKSLSPSEQEEC